MADGLHLPDRRPAEPLQRHEQVRPPDGPVPARAAALRRLPARRRAALGAEARAADASTSSPPTAWSRTTPTPAPTSRPSSTAFLDRFRQVAPAWDVSEATEVVELGREGVWVPDYRFVHQATGTDVLVEVLGFWKRSSLERLLRLLPEHGPPRYVLAISDRLKVDEEALGELAGPGPPVQGDPQRPRAGRAARPHGRHHGRTAPHLSDGAARVLHTLRSTPGSLPNAVRSRPGRFV